MENASKALIIAGAILLAILLISLSIFIFSQAQDTINNSGMNQAEITAFNQKFTKYEGTMKGSSVRTMIQEVIATIADENNQNAGVTITMTLISGSSSKNITNSSSIVNTKSYLVECTGYTSGRVSAITITEQ